MPNSFSLVQNVIAAMNLQAEPPDAKRRKKKTAKRSSSPPPTPPFFSLLPEEIIENCLARVPRSYYPKLSLVSKSFWSLLSSTQIYAARTRLGVTQQCLYVCLSDLNASDFQWYTLSIDPNLITKKKNKKRTLKQLLVPIPSSSFGTLAKPTVVGSEIYIIGGRKVPLSTVRVLDCRSHTWRDAPSMTVARENPVSCFYEGKIYVMGGVRNFEQGSPFAEVFDTKTLSWESLPDPSAEVRTHYLQGIVEIEGEIHIRDGYSLFPYYDTRQCKWGKKNAMFPWSGCVMDNLLYSFGKHGDTGPYNLWWGDMNGGNRKEVKGLESLGNSYKRCGGSNYTTKLATCGGKLYLMWAWYMKKHKPFKVKICCAEISLEKRDGDEIWGNVEWLNIVHTPKLCRPLHFLAMSV